MAGIGFTMGTNAFEQGLTPTSAKVADGYYHPGDEALMPWFMRLSPGTSQDGRYTLMGNLNPRPCGMFLPGTCMP